MRTVGHLPRMPSLAAEANLNACWTTQLWLWTRLRSALAPQRALFASAPLLVRAKGAFGGLRASAGVLAAGPAPLKPYSCQPAETHTRRLPPEPLLSAST